MELQDIVPCDPPETRPDRSDGPTLPVDHAIVAALQVEGRMELRSITAAVQDTTHHVHARLARLREKGVVGVERIPGGPRRGPGSSEYFLVNRP